MNKKEAIKRSDEWWLNELSKKDNYSLINKYKIDNPNNTIWLSIDDTLRIYLSEHPEIQITETPTLFEKCENLWQNLNAVVLLEGKVDMEFLKQVLITNKPSKDDK